MDIEKFDFNNFPMKLSGKTVIYICPKCKYKFDAPIEAVTIADDFPKNIKNA